MLGPQPVELRDDGHRQVQVGRQALQDAVQPGAARRLQVKLDQQDVELLDGVGLDALAEAAAEVGSRRPEGGGRTALAAREVGHDLADEVTNDVEVPLPPELQPGQPEFAQQVLHLDEAVFGGLLLERERREQVVEQVVEGRELGVSVRRLDHAVKLPVVRVLVVPGECGDGSAVVVDGAVAPPATGVPGVPGAGGRRFLHRIDPRALCVEAPRVDVVHHAGPDAEEALLGTCAAALLVPPVDGAVDEGFGRQVAKACGTIVGATGQAML